MQSGLPTQHIMNVDITDALRSNSTRSFYLCAIYYILYILLLYILYILLLYILYIIYIVIVYICVLYIIYYIYCYCTYIILQDK